MTHLCRMKIFKFSDALFNIVERNGREESRVRLRQELYIGDGNEGKLCLEYFQSKKKEKFGAKFLAADIIETISLTLSTTLVCHIGLNGKLSNFSKKKVVKQIKLKNYRETSADGTQLSRNYFSLRSLSGEDSIAYPDVILIQLLQHM